jgi:hypothetical protein
MSEARLRGGLMQPPRQPAGCSFSRRHPLARRMASSVGIGPTFVRHSALLVDLPGSDHGRDLALPQRRSEREVPGHTAPSRLPDRARTRWNRSAGGGAWGHRSSVGWATVTRVEPDGRALAAGPDWHGPHLTAAPPWPDARSTCKSRPGQASGCRGPRRGIHGCRGASLMSACPWPCHAAGGQWTRPGPVVGRCGAAGCVRVQCAAAVVTSRSARPLGVRV